MILPENSPGHEGVVNTANEQQLETEPRPSWLEKIRAIRHRLPLVVRLPLAILFLAIGVAGGFIPILQGWVFVLAAIWLIFPDHAEQLVDKARAWFRKFKLKRKT